jgi:hypothetical protein
MADPEEIPENTMAFSAGNFSADTCGLYFH